MCRHMKNHERIWWQNAGLSVGDHETILDSQYTGSDSGLSVGDYGTTGDCLVVWLIDCLLDWLIDFIYIRGKPEKAAIAYLAGDLMTSCRLCCDLPWSPCGALLFDTNETMTTMITWSYQHCAITNTVTRSPNNKFVVVYHGSTLGTTCSMHETHCDVIQVCIKEHKF